MTAPAIGFAFFDVDETLIAMKSMFDFFPYWCARQGRPELAQRFDHAFAAARSQGQRREQLNALYYSFFAGSSLQELEAAGSDWFDRRFRTAKAPYIAATVTRLNAHRSAGVAPVFVSGSMLPLLAPLADELGVAHCLCTSLVLDAEGRLTGGIAAPQTIGRGKAEALRLFLHQHGASASHSYAYGDDVSDVPMLEAVGLPVAVGNNSDLAEVANARNWTRLQH